MGNTTETLNMQELAAEALTLAKNTLLVNLRFLDMALYQFVYVAEENTTIGTDGRLLRYNPAYVLKKFRENAEGFTRDYLHTVFHCLLHHPFVSKKVNRDLWDLAGDIAAESAIDELNLRCSFSPLSEYGVSILSELRDKVPVLSAERLYRYFCDIGLSEGEAARMREPFERDDHEAWWYVRIEAGSSYCVDEDDDTVEHGQALPNAGDKQPKVKRTVTEQIWRDVSEKTLSELETVSRVWGESATLLVHGLRRCTRESYDYTEFLRSFAVFGENVQINHDEFDCVFYTYGLQLYENMPLVEPLEYKEVKRIREFVIAIDTSGSVQGELVERFINKTYNILSQVENFFEKVNLHIIQCNTAVQDDSVITSRKDFDDYMSKLEIRGSGGTDFRPVFEHVNALIEKGELPDLRGLIYFTDGLGSFPEKMPQYRTAFVFVGDDSEQTRVPVWAIKLNLEADEL